MTQHLINVQDTQDARKSQYLQMYVTITVCPLRGRILYTALTPNVLEPLVDVHEIARPAVGNPRARILRLT